MFRVAAIDTVRAARVARPRVASARAHAARWRAASSGGDADVSGEDTNQTKRPKPGGRARVVRRRAPSGGDGSSAPAPVRRRAVRTSSPTGSGDDRGRARTDEEKARAMRELKAKAAAPRVAALADALASACAADKHRDAAKAYAEIKAVPDADIPLPVFESMLHMYDRLLMVASAEGVFIDALAAGHAPTDDICWSLLRAFERAGEGRRADKVLAYMEARGML